VSGAPAETLHASAVAWQGRAVLILGRAGSGKSGLALELMAYGCDLVSDDRTLVAAAEGCLWASPPPAIAGRIEARGIGILPAAHVARARLVLAADLDRTETARLPERRHISVCGIALPLVARVEGRHFPASLMQFLRAGSDVPV